MRLRTITILLVCACLLWFYCVIDNITGNTSEVGNATVLGMIYQPDGITPAAGVKVAIRPKKTLADTGSMLWLHKDTATVTTNANGRFAFDSTLDTGTYVIEAASGNDAVLIDSVVVKNITTTDTLPPDTLKPAGAIKGIIYLSEGGDPRKVFVLAFGIDRFARVEADGRFRFQNLAEARYDLRVISSLDDYGVLDTTAVPVLSADTTNLDTVELPFIGIPTPKNVKISYDTMKQIVTLTWSKADTVLVKGYNVYRRNVDSNTVLARINTSPVTDTVYRDSSGVQDMTYEYKVTALDKQGNEGKLGSGVSVKVVGAFKLIRSWGGLGNGNGQFNNPVSLVTDSKGFLYVVDNNNNRIQVFDTNGQYIRQFGDTLLDQPWDIAVIDTLAFISCNGSKRICKFSTHGDFISRWDLPIEAYFPRIAVDTNFNVHVLLHSSKGSIQVYNDTGSLQYEYSIGSNNALRVSIENNRVFVNSFNDPVVLLYSLTGDSLTTLNLDIGTRPVAITSDSTRLFVLNRSTNTMGEILVYSKSLQFIGKWGGNYTYIQVYDIAKDRFGNIYILDADDRKIHQFSELR